MGWTESPLLRVAGVVENSFTDGPGAATMGMLEKWGVADERWKLHFLANAGLL